MDAIAKASRQSFRMRGRSYVAFTFCPVVPIAGWLEEIDVTLARSPRFFAGKPAVLDLSAVDLIRGRAMAGSSDNAAARIFCRKIEAELLTINGYYRSRKK
jgi:septum formation inhibitor MinC